MTPTASNTKPAASRERALKLFIVLSRAMNAVTAHLEWHPDRNELTMTEFGILEALLHKGPLLLGDVQKKILLSSGGVTYTIDRLAEKGLVERQECKSDRRAKYAALTPKGQALIKRLFQDQATRIEEMMSVLSAREQDDATALVRKLGLAVARAEAGVAMKASA
ncbi:MAG: MarR family transcriptional regulator [Gemmatimonadota bacterium]|mgnify:CR=1 FL=1